MRISENMTIYEVTKAAIENWNETNDTQQEER